MRDFLFLFSYLSYQFCLIDVLSHRCWRYTHFLSSPFRVNNGYFPNSASLVQLAMICLGEFSLAEAPLPQFLRVLCTL